MHYESTYFCLFSLQFCIIYGNGLSQYKQRTGNLLCIVPIWFYRKLLYNLEKTPLFIGLECPCGQSIDSHIHWLARASRCILVLKLDYLVFFHSGSAFFKRRVLSGLKNREPGKCTFDNKYGGVSRRKRKFCR